MAESLYEELEWRGFVNQTTLTSPKQLDSKKFKFYWGVDPSSDSMTIGNLAAAMMVRHFINHGHTAVLLVGGATGVIGDPDGKSKERKLLSKDELEKNKQAIADQYKTVFDGADFEIVDNSAWFKDINYIDFLRDVGKHVPIRQMLAREFVQSRLGEDGSGISYAEFSYSLIQGYDFLHLFRTKDVSLQLCGSDQWGNSITGVDLIRRIEGKEAHVWSSPLVVNKATGAKFGKTEEGAIWLDPNKTSVYDFYQFWLNVDDDSAEDYLKIYTLLPKEEIEKIINEFEKDRGQRKAQKVLATEATKLVHGQKNLESVERITACLFGGDEVSKLTSEDIETMKQFLPSAGVKAGDNLLEALVKTGLVSSNSEARRMLAQKAISLNGQTVDENFVINQSDAIISGHALLKRGKNKYLIIKVI